MNRRADNILIWGALALLLAIGAWWFLAGQGAESVGSGAVAVEATSSDTTSGASTDDPLESPEAASEWSSLLGVWFPASADYGRSVSVADLPDEAWDTLTLIGSDGPFPYGKDGSVFQNREGLLPDESVGHYREYTVDTPGLDHRGARRIVGADSGELYYTDDHYDSFRQIIDPG